VTRILGFRTTAERAAAGVRFGLRLDSGNWPFDDGGGNSLGNLVGLPGFEPGTSCTPSKRASQAAPQPETISIAANVADGAFWQYNRIL
jgi:hypothetical protein